MAAPGQRETVHISDHAENSEYGEVHIKQRFLEPIVAEDAYPEKEKSYDALRNSREDDELTTPKSEATVSRLGEQNQLFMHTIDKIYSDDTPQMVGSQFKAMRLDWRCRSFDRKHPDSLLGDWLRLAEDARLSEAVAHVRVAGGAGKSDG